MSKRSPLSLALPDSVFHVVADLAESDLHALGLDLFPAVVLHFLDPVFHVRFGLEFFFEMVVSQRRKHEYSRGIFDVADVLVDLARGKLQIDRTQVNGFIAKGNCRIANLLDLDPADAAEIGAFRVDRETVDTGCTGHGYSNIEKERGRLITAPLDCVYSGIAK